MQVVREIGRGGFGVVHEIVDANGHHFARKTYSINQAFTNTPETDALLRPRFYREAKLQSGIQHRNVAPILSKELDANPPYFLMPLAESTLEKDLAQDRTLGGQYLAAIMDIIAALEEIHPMRIYHRDLKPGNVLRFNDPKDPRGYFYAISDFGLVALKQTQVSVLTQVGMKMTSDFYTAPEITSDLAKASPQSDIYSIGCILHEMVGLEDRVPCAEISDKSPYGPILLNCTRKDPSRRFKSVSVLRDILLDVAVSNPAASTSTPLAQPLQLLTSAAALSQDQWAYILDEVSLDQNSAGARQVLRAITIPRIEEVFANFPAIANGLGRKYADWIRDNAFDFSECDGLANRLERIFELAEMDVRAEALMAMLYMGTSHNRWYVEGKFVALTSMLDAVQAKRLAIECRADDNRFCKAIQHLEISIGINRSALHPVLQETLRQTCP